MQNRNWREYSDSYKPLVDTGREEIELKKYPNDLDFHKTMGGTTYLDYLQLLNLRYCQMVVLALSAVGTFDCCLLFGCPVALE